MTTAVEIAVEADEATRTELLETMSRELVRMRALVEDLMTLVQADAQRLVTDWTDVDLDDLLDLEVPPAAVDESTTGGRALQPRTGSRGCAPTCSGAAERDRQRGAVRRDDGTAEPRR